MLHRMAAMSANINFEPILEDASVIYYSLDPKGLILNISQSSKTVLGYGVEELIGTYIFDLIHPDDRRRLKAEWISSIRNRDKNVRTAEYRISDYRHSMYYVLMPPPCALRGSFPGRCWSLFPRGRRRYVPLIHCLKYQKQ